MRIAFYAPLKSPSHPVPSGDRLMARLLMEAMTTVGHRVTVASDLRPFLRDPDAGLLHHYQTEAQNEVRRIETQWQSEGAPDLWFTYHPYYKAPDLIGPKLASEWGIPYVTAESSWSGRRTQGDWGRAQGFVADALAQAALNICMTERDRLGILEGVAQARTARLLPFIDTAPFRDIAPAPVQGHLVTVAMMRPGDKLSSYLALAQALRHLRGAWTLSVVGDGPEAPAIHTAFAEFGAERVHFLGALSAEAIAQLLSTGAVYVWPGHAEAYGLAYLEAQAAGLPVVAEAVAGVPEVVEDGITGDLVTPDDPKAFALALEGLLHDPKRRETMARAARHFVLTERSLESATRRLQALLSQAGGTQ